MDKQTLQFQLTIDETNLILDALGQLPFNRVYQLVNKLQEQATSQLNASQGENIVEPQVEAQTQSS